MNPITFPVFRTLDKSANAYRTVDVICFHRQADNTYIANIKIVANVIIHGKTKQSMHAVCILMHIILDIDAKL